ncbi:hypothetical protein ABW19_dt0207412 [Dactylella cylindrospora]|nr:hypothetical protein ABW19_dt0207412 [Dactylella cylindrospora]
MANTVKNIEWPYPLRESLEILALVKWRALYEEDERIAQIVGWQSIYPEMRKQGTTVRAVEFSAHQLETMLKRVREEVKDFGSGFDLIYASGPPFTGYTPPGGFPLPVFGRRRAAPSTGPSPAPAPTGPSLVPPIGPSPALAQSNWLPIGIFNRLQLHSSQLPPPQPLSSQPANHPFRRNPLRNSNILALRRIDSGRRKESDYKITMPRDIPYNKHQTRDLAQFKSLLGFIFISWDLADFRREGPKLTDLTIHAVWTQTLRRLAERQKPAWVTHLEDKGVTTLDDLCMDYLEGGESTFEAVLLDRLVLHLFDFVGSGETSWQLRGLKFEDVEAALKAKKRGGTSEAPLESSALVADEDSETLAELKKIFEEDLRRWESGGG